MEKGATGRGLHCLVMGIVIIACFCCLFTAREVRAEQLLGVYPGGSEAPSETAAGYTSGRNGTTKQGGAPAAPMPTLERHSEGSGLLGEDWTISGGFGVGPGYVNGLVSMGYALTRWLFIEPSYMFFRRDGRDLSGQQYGPEITMVWRWHNKTVLTPFVGAGPGFLKWTRAEKQAVFDDGSSATANVFGGLSLALTKHFGLQVTRRQLTYLTQAPKSYGVPHVFEPKSSLSNQLGFVVMF